MSTWDWLASGDDGYVGPDPADGGLDRLGAGSAWPQTPDGRPWSYGLTTDADGWPHPPIFPEDVPDIRALGLDNWSRLSRITRSRPLGGDPLLQATQPDPDAALQAADGPGALAFDDAASSPADLAPPPPDPSVVPGAHAAAALPPIDQPLSDPADGYALDAAPRRRRSPPPAPPVAPLFAPYDPETDPNRVHHGIDWGRQPTTGNSFDGLALRGFPLQPLDHPGVPRAGHDPNADWYGERPALEAQAVDQAENNTFAGIATGVAKLFGADERDQYRAASLAASVGDGLTGVAGLRGAPPELPGVARPAMGEPTAPEAVTDDVPQPEGITYERIDATGRLAPYTGQVKNYQRFLARQGEHARANPNSRFYYRIVEHVRPGDPLTRAEHEFIQFRTSRQKAGRSPAVSNQRDPVGQRRRPRFGLPEPKD